MQKLINLIFLFFYFILFTNFKYMYSHKISKFSSQKAACFFSSLFQKSVWEFRTCSWNSSKSRLQISSLISSFSPGPTIGPGEDRQIRQGGSLLVDSCSAEKCFLRRWGWSSLLDSHWWLSGVFEDCTIQCRKSRIRDRSTRQCFLWLKLDKRMRCSADAELGRKSWALGTSCDARFGLWSWKKRLNFVKRSYIFVKKITFLKIYEEMRKFWTVKNSILP